MFLCVFVPSDQVNPALTLSMLVTRKLDALRAFVFIVAQCLGAFLGTGALYLALPRKSTADFFVNKVSSLFVVFCSLRGYLSK